MSNDTVNIGTARIRIYPTTQPVRRPAPEPVTKLTATPVVAATVTRKPTTTPEVNPVNTFSAAENEIRAQFGLPSRAEANAISYAMTAAWGRVMESAKKCAYLEQSIFASMNQYHEDERRLDATEKAIMKKSEVAE